MSMKDLAKVTVRWKVQKFKAKNTKEIREKGLKPYEIVEKEHNCLLNEGITVLINLLCGLGLPTAFDNSNAYLGVGDDGTAPAPSQTGLQGASKTYKGMNAGYPQISGQDSKWQADFVDGEAEYAWNEETVANGNSDSADNLCRQNTSLGTKPTGQTWRLTATITWS